jgi:restriction system protein
MQAIDVLETYFLAHALELPDGRNVGIGDAQAVIRAMWIGNPVSGAEKRELVFQLGHRRFEHLLERPYAEMGFETTLTAPKGDGGRDVIAAKDVPGEKQRTLIECKLWRTAVGVPVVRGLLGAVSHERSTKGVVAAASHFTKPARAFASENSRIELLGWNRLLPLLDRYLGADWGRNVDRYIAESVSQTSDPESG